MNKTKRKKTKENENGFFTKRNLILLVSSVFILGLVGLYFLLRGFSNESSLEDYILDKYKNNEGVQSVLYGESDLDEDDLIIVDYSNEDVDAEPYDLENYAGVIEFDDVSFLYEFEDGKLITKDPEEDIMVRRVPILHDDTENLPDLYFDTYYNDDGDIEVTKSYFLGESDYAFVEILNSDKTKVRTIRYVQPDSFQCLVAELSTYGEEFVARDEVDVNGEEYLRYEVFDSEDELGIHEEELEKKSE